MAKNSNYISYYGGKNAQSKWCYSQITPEMKKSIKTFTEVFSGAFWIYFNEDFSFADKIIYNDMNAYLTNFYASVSDTKYAEHLEHLSQPGELLYYNENLKSTPKEISCLSISSIDIESSLVMSTSPSPFLYLLSIIKFDLPS